MPISSGAGWSWGPRSRDRAFIIGVGRGGYVGDEGWGSGRKAQSSHSTSIHGKHEADSSMVNGGGAVDNHAIGGVAPMGTQQEYSMELQNGVLNTSHDEHAYTTTQADHGLAGAQPRREYGSAI